MQLDAMVPRSASNVSHEKRPDGSTAVSFQIVSRPDSYDHIDVIRKDIKALGYELCTKSAVSKWAPRPTSAQDHADKKFWIVEVYSSSHYTKFLTLRVFGSPSNDRRTWSQQFSVASQEVQEGRQNMDSIKEFCD